MMSHSRFRVLPLLMITGALACTSLPLSAQDAVPPIPLDSRVRVTTTIPRSPEFVGALASWDMSSLGLSKPGYGLQTVALSNVARLEISRGQNGNARKGMWIGLAVGLVGGTVAAAFAFDEENDAYGLGSIATVIYSSAGGVALGAGIGALMKSERWEEVTLPAVVEPAPHAAAATWGVRQ